jgi:hypothetical protein
VRQFGCTTYWFFLAFQLDITGENAKILLLCARKTTPRGVSKDARKRLGKAAEKVGICKRGAAGEAGRKRLTGVPPKQILKSCPLTKGGRHTKSTVTPSKGEREIRAVGRAGSVQCPARFFDRPVLVELHMRNKRRA